MYFSDPIKTIEILGILKPRAFQRYKICAFWLIIERTANSQSLDQVKNVFCLSCKVRYFDIPPFGCQRQNETSLFIALYVRASASRDLVACFTCRFRLRAQIHGQANSFPELSSGTCPTFYRAFLAMN